MGGEELFDLVGVGDYGFIVGVAAAAFEVDSGVYGGSVPGQGEDNSDRNACIVGCEDRSPAQVGHDRVRYQGVWCRPKQDIVWDAILFFSNNFNYPECGDIDLKKTLINCRAFCLRYHGVQIDIVKVYDIPTYRSFTFFSPPDLPVCFDPSC